MADGKTHQRVATTLLLGGTLAAGITGGALGIATKETMGVAAGLLMGWLLTPDLDVDGQTIEETRWLKIPLVGTVIYVLFRAAFAPYAVLMPHRSFWSHGIGIGTALRMAYTALLIYAVSHVWVWAIVPWPVLLCVFVGWAIQDVGHWLLDMF